MERPDATLRIALFALLLAILFMAAQARPASVDGGPAELARWFGKKDKDGKEKKRESRKQAGEEEVDYLGLAALMIRDGYYGRAEAVLSEADETDPGLDRARYHTLRGIVYLQRGFYGQSRDDFLKAIELSEDEPDRLIYLYLAQAHYGLKEYEETIAALDKSGARAEGMADIQAMKAVCYWNMDDKARCFGELDKAISAYPDRRDLRRQKIVYLIEMGLFQEAIGEGEIFLAGKEADASDYVFLGEALRRGRQYPQSLALLEEARVRYPGHEKITLSLAHSYLDSGRPLTAARLFEQASHRNPKLNSEAAELYRRAGEHERALYMNSQVRDQKEKMRQRLGILLEQGRFEEAAAMEARLSRLGLLEEGKVRYALAYCYFKTGRLGESRKHIKRIGDSELLDAGAQLLKAIEVCNASEWQCL